MKTYPKMKDSGIKWIGDIPKHWKIKKLKFLGKSITGLTYSPEDVTENNNGLLVLRASNIQNGKISLDDTVFVSSEVDPKLITRENDVLICSRSGSKELIGKNILITKQFSNCTFGAFMTIFRSLHNKYISNVFNSSLFQNQTGSFMTTTINQLTLGTLNNFSIPFSENKDEQKKIGKFLKQKISKIDLEITRNEKLVEHLHNKRQASIDEAVTKGLDSSSSTRYSGIPWIGKIPNDWKIEPLKFHVKINDKKIDGTVDKNLEIAYIDIGSVFQDGTIDKSEKMKFGDAPSRARRIVSENDTIISTVRTYLKAIAFIDERKDNHICSTGFAVITPSDSLIPKFLFWLFRSTRYIDMIMANSIGVTYPAINASDLGKFPCILPSKDEQKKIEEFLDKKINMIDDAIYMISCKIKKLKEFREVVITSTITGKIDIREAVA